MDEPNTGIDFPENDFLDSQTAENIFLFRKLAFPENMYFPEIVLRQPNAPWVVSFSPFDFCSQTQLTHDKFSFAGWVIFELAIAQPALDMPELLWKVPAILGYQNNTFNGIILTLCSINIIYNCTFVTFGNFLYFFSHSMVPSSYYVVPTWHVTVLLSHSVVPLFFFSHLMVSSSHCATPTSHVIVLFRI